MARARKSGRPRKFQPGDPVESLDDLVVRRREDAWLWIHGRPQHIAWVINHSCLALRYQVTSGQLRWAEITDDYREWIRKEAASAGISLQEA